MNKFNYKPSDQYHKITLKSGISLCGTINDSANDLRIELVRSKESLPLSGTVKIPVSEVVDIIPIEIESKTYIYIMVSINTDHIKGLEQAFDKFDSECNPKWFESTEYYKVQVDKNLSDEQISVQIRDYLYKFITYWGSFKIITKEEYTQAKSQSPEVEFINTYGVEGKQVLGMLEYLNVEHRFIYDIAKQILANSESNRKNIALAIVKDFQ